MELDQRSDAGCCLRFDWGSYSYLTLSNKCAHLLNQGDKACCGWALDYLMERLLWDVGSSVDPGPSSWPRCPPESGPATRVTPASGADRGWQSQSRHCPSRGQRSPTWGLGTIILRQRPIISPDRLNNGTRNKSRFCITMEIAFSHTSGGRMFKDFLNIENFWVNSNI